MLKSRVSLAGLNICRIFSGQKLKLQPCNSNMIIVRYIRLSRFLQSPLGLSHPVAMAAKTNGRNM